MSTFCLLCGYCISVRRECLAQLPKLLLHLIYVGRHLALGISVVGRRRFDEGEIRPRLIARDQIALAGQLILRLAKGRVGSLMSQLRIDTTALLLPDCGGRAGGRTVGGSSPHTQQNGGNGIETEDDEKGGAYSMRRRRPCSCTVLRQN